MRNEILGCVVSVVVISSLFTSAHAQNNRTSSIADRVREMDDDDLICKLNICSYRVRGNREPTILIHISIAAIFFCLFFFFLGGGKENNADPDQTSQNAAFHQDLHYLLSKRPIRN